MLGPALAHCAAIRYTPTPGGPAVSCARDALDPETNAVALPAGALAWLDAAANRSFDDAVRVGLARDALSALKACALDLARKAADTPLKTLDSGLL